MTKIDRETGERLSRLLRGIENESKAIDTFTWYYHQLFTDVLIGTKEADPFFWKVIDRTFDDLQSSVQGLAERLNAFKEASMSLRSSTHA